MGRVTWVCATCGEHFTRKYSASRHNNNNNTNMYETSDPFYYYPTPNTVNNADDKSANKVQDRKRKYDELGTLVAKYYTAEAAEKTLAVAGWYLSQGDDRAMDEILATLRKNLEGR